MPDRPITVLVVDDNPDFLEQMKLALEAAGITVVAADSGAAAACCRAWRISPWNSCCAGNCISSKKSRRTSSQRRAASRFTGS